LLLSHILRRPKMVIKIRLQISANKGKNIICKVTKWPGYYYYYYKSIDYSDDSQKKYRGTLHIDYR